MNKMQAWGYEFKSPRPQKKKSGPLECTCNHIIGGVEMLTPGLPVSLAKSLTPNSVRDPVFKKMRWNVTGEDTQHWPLAYTTHTHTTICDYMLSNDLLGKWIETEYSCWLDSGFIGEIEWHFPRGGDFFWNKDVLKLPVVTVVHSCKYIKQH